MTSASSKPGAYADSVRSNRTVESVQIDRSYPTAERVAGVAVEAGIALGAEAMRLGSRSTIGVVAVAEVLDVRPKTEQMVRDLTANTTTRFNNGSTDVAVNHGLAKTVTTTDAQGHIVRDVRATTNTIAETTFDKNRQCEGTTVYTRDTGIHRYDGNGKYQGSSCVIH